ncbi:unnamed protein product, partial [marine sediment metagenome]
DPPYDSKSVPLYKGLATLASRILEPGGSLICYCGHRLIRKVIEQFDDTGLTFYWLAACIHTGQSVTLRTGEKVTWKPMLWFVKGPERKNNGSLVEDSVVSEPSGKDHHEWEQGAAEAIYYIDKLTQHGDLVVDPFCGGGTTAVAADQLRRRCFTCDIEESCVQTAKERLRDSRP